MIRYSHNYTSYGFDPVTLAPDEERKLKITVNGVFRAQKLMMTATMDDVRGHFKIRHTRLPLLNRENVIAYSNMTKVASKRRTTVEYREHATGNFVRTYLPSSVKYVHTDPLEYVRLIQLYCGKQPQMPNLGAGVHASAFAADSLGNGLPLASSDSKIEMVLKNKGDIEVRVGAAIMGVELAR